MVEAVEERRGFSLVELLVVCGVLSLLMLVAIPAVQASREAARQTQCISRLRQLGVALSNYESAHTEYPEGRGSPDWRQAGIEKSIYTSYRDVNQDPIDLESTGYRSVQVSLLPFMEEGSLYQDLRFDRALSMRMTANGLPYNVNYAAYVRWQEEFLCPSDSEEGVRPTDNNFRYNFGGNTPYAGALSTRQQSQRQGFVDGLPVAGNGAFTIGTALRPSDFVDGLSKTAFFAERSRGSGGAPARDLPRKADIVTVVERSVDVPSRDMLFERCNAYQADVSPFHFMSAGRWLADSDYSNGWPFAAYTATMYNHVAPPNWSGFDCGSWSAIADTPGEHAIVSARSNHRHVVNVLFGDGHVVATNDDVELDVWRHLGNRADEN